MCGPNTGPQLPALLTLAPGNPSCLPSLSFAPVSLAGPRKRDISWDGWVGCMGPWVSQGGTGCGHLPQPGNPFAGHSAEGSGTQLPLPGGCDSLHVSCPQRGGAAGPWEGRQLATSPVRPGHINQLVGRRGTDASRSQ